MSLPSCSSLLNVASRIAIAVPFVYMGYQAVKEPGARVNAVKNVGIPEEYADAAVRANGAVMVLGGLAVGTGNCSRLGGLAVAGSMVPTTLAAHSFWKDTDPKARGANRIQFLKNLGMVGGLLAVAARPRRTACKRQD